MINYNFYQLQNIQRIAETNNSKVYQASIENEVVIVKLPTNNTSGINEAKILSTIIHPNIIRLQGVVVDRPPSMVLEYMNQGDLHDYLLRNNSPGIAAKDAATRDNILIDVLCGLSFLHSIALVHRDIKCKNILLTLLASGKLLAKLCDFGGAKQIDLESQIYVSGLAQPVGTPGYVAPEILDTNNPHKRCEYTTKGDVFAFGRVVLATKSDNLNPNFSHLDPEQLPAFPKEITADTKEMLLLCFKINPDERISAANLLKRLSPKNELCMSGKHRQ